MDSETKFDRRLDDICYKDCKEYFQKIETGKIVKVYDGDSVTIATFIDDTPYKFSVRMLGYDCAEMRSKDETEKRVAHLAQEDLSAMIIGQYVTVTKNEGADKYGRLLLTLDHNGTDVNEYMKKKWGVEYDGGHKGFVDWSGFPRTN